MYSRADGAAACVALALLAAIRPGHAADEAAPAAAAIDPATVPIGPVPGPAAEAPLPSNPLPATAEVRLHGRELFEMFNCVGCHGGHGGGGIGPSLRDEIWRYGDSDAHVFSSIAQGRAFGMPAWGSLLPPQEIWALVAYIKSLRTPDEARPPR
ncbi:MAG: cytochrome c [Gammaproteobacteria bacterium]